MSTANVVNLAAFGVPTGDFVTQSYVYASDPQGNIWQYDTSAVHLNSIPSSITPTLVTTGGKPNCQIAALWAAADTNRWTIRVYYVNNDNHIADVGKNMGDTQWTAGVLSQMSWGRLGGTGLQYAIANNSLVRIGFWSSDGTFHEAQAHAAVDGNPSEWSEQSFIVTAVTEPA